jgi:hypothetical protein
VTIPLDADPVALGRAAGVADFEKWRKIRTAAATATSTVAASFNRELVLRRLPSTA